MAAPGQGVVWDGDRGEHVVVVVLDADEAENVANSLGTNDKGGAQLRQWADEARMLDQNVVFVPVWR